MATILFGSSDASGSTLVWKSGDWKTSDDRVRGGSSFSSLDVTEEGKLACFNGNLDIDTLGGAGFASQRSAEDLDVDLSEAQGIQLDIQEVDSMQYTLILKDKSLPRNADNGREQATISWEYSFYASTNKKHKDAMYIRVGWNDFKPTYRGKPVEDAAPLNKTGIKSISIMARSQFGAQKGNFSITLKSISTFMGEPSRVGRVIQRESNRFPYPYKDITGEMTYETCFDEKAGSAALASHSSRAFLNSMRCCTGRL